MSRSSVLEAAWEEIEEKRYDIIRQYLELLRKRSVTHEDRNARLCAEFIQSRMAEMGIGSTQLLETSHNPVVFGEVRGAEGAPTVILYAHYDTKPAEGQVGWGNYPPLAPTVVAGFPTDDAKRVGEEALDREKLEELRVVCRGAADDKLGVWELIRAVAAYIRTGEQLPVTVKFVLEGDEEVGSPPMKDFLERNKELLKSDVFIVADGSKAPEGPRLLLGARGICHFELKITGARLDVHSGSFGDVITNPAEKLARLITSFQDADGRVLIEGFYDSVAPATEAQRQMMTKLPFDQEKAMQEIGLEERDWELPPGRSYYEAIMFWPTFNLDGFVAGTNSTIVPSEATAWVDIRMVPDMDFEDMKEKVLRHIEKQGFPPSIVKRISGYSPYRCPPDNRFAQAVIKGLEQAFGREILVYPSLGGSVPISLFNQELGVPCIGVPLGNHDAQGHGPRENLRLQDLIDGTKAIVSILSCLGQAG